MPNWLNIIHPPKNFLSTIWAVAAVAVISFVALQYGHNSWEYNLRQNLVGLEQVKQCRIKLAEGHLWFEEILSGDRYIKIEEVWALLDQAELSLQMALMGESSVPGFKGLPVEDKAVREMINGLINDISAFKGSAQTRWENRLVAGTGSRLDQEFDEAFFKLSQRAQNIEAVVIRGISEMMDYQANLHILLIVLLSLVFLTVFTGLIYSQRVQKTAEKRRRELEEQLRQSQKMEAIGTLAGGIAHDFNNILAVVIGFTELGLAKAADGENNTEELQKLLAASQRATELVKQILDFSRKSSAQKEVLVLNKTIVQVMDLVRRTLPRMVEIEMHLPSDVNPIEADPTQLEQVLLNLCSNAADAMPTGGKLVIETENIRLDEEYRDRRLEIKPGDYVLLKITDTGQGMDKQTLDKIFDPFFTTKAVGKGTGLGLSTVFGIIKQHDGHINCYSEPGRGTTFKIYWPAWQKGLRTETKPEMPPISIKPDGSSNVVLLVDDEKDLQDLGKKMLESGGYRVLAAGSGEEALDIYQRNDGRVDLVLLDLSMPGMGGQACLERLQELDPKVKVVITSGYSRNGMVKDILQAGASGFIAKPFRKSELLSVMADNIDSQN